MDKLLYNSHIPMGYNPEEFGPHQNPVKEYLEVNNKDKVVHDVVVGELKNFMLTYKDTCVWKNSTKKLHVDYKVQYPNIGYFRGFIVHKISKLSSEDIRVCINTFKTQGENSVYNFINNLLINLNER